MLAAAVLLLSLAYLQSCAVGRTGGTDRGDNKAGGIHEKADSVEFVPLHPPVVVPHTWREGTTL